ncbi:MAG: TVP38/TMEM64 family protein [Acidobacteriota bacterium]
MSKQNETTGEAPSRNPWKTAAMVAGVVAVAVIALFVLRQSGIEPRAVGQWLKSVGDRWWAPLVFIGLYAVFDTFLLPATVLTLTAGVVWGWLAGGLWVLAASTVGSAIPYFIARSGSGWAHDLFERKAGRVYGTLRNEGFMTLLLMRLVPIVPYNVLNYAAGLAGIRVRDYLAATFAGTIPGIFIFTYLASSIAAGVVSPKAAFVRILIAGALLAILALVSRYFAGKIKSRMGVGGDRR